MAYRYINHFPSSTQTSPSFIVLLLVLYLKFHSLTTILLLFYLFFIIHFCFIVISCTWLMINSISGLVLLRFLIYTLSLLSF